MKNFFKKLFAIIGMTIGAFAAYFIIKKMRPQIRERAVKQLAPTAPWMELKEYKERVVQKETELASAKATEIMEAWAKRFGG